MKKLLVIENDIDTLEITSFILENEFEVSTSVKRLSVEEIEKINPGIIIIDYLLDDCFGSEICLEIKKNPSTKNVPVILFSASPNLETIANESFADAFIEKPFDLDDLVNMVKKLASS